MWSNMQIHVWFSCPYAFLQVLRLSFRKPFWLGGASERVYIHTHINTYSNYIFISLLVYCVHNYFPYCCYVWQWYGLSYFPCKFIPINEFLYAHKINAKPMWTWSFRQVTGLSRLALLWTEYKVSWAYEGDEMTGATRASLRGLRMTTVSDHENACYCNISKEAHQHTSCWKNSEHWWEICSFSSVLTLSLSQEMAVFPFWPAENMPKHLTRLRASVVGADILLWRSDAHCMPCDRGAWRTWAPFWGQLHIPGLPVFDPHVKAQQNVINPLEVPWQIMYQCINLNKNLCNNGVLVVLYVYAWRRETWGLLISKFSSEISH